MDKDRQSEIQAKRAKIAELRRLREEKLSQNSSPENTSKNNNKQDRESIDQLVDSLVGNTSSSSHAAESQPGQTSTGNLASYEDDESETTTNATTNTGIFALSISPVFDIPPDSSQISATKSDIETYSKEVQTEECFVQTSDDTYDTNDIKESEDELRARLEQQIRQELENTSINNDNNSNTNKINEKKLRPDSSTIKDLQNDDLDNAQQNDNNTNGTQDSTPLDGLEKFLSQSSKVIGRAIDDDYDILIDYAEKGARDSTEDTSSNGNVLTEYCQLSSSFSNGRAITGLDWSLKFPELLASSHTEKASDPHAPKGLIQIWNMHYKTRPEYVFHAQSDVLNVKFSPYEPNLIFGTSYNGQVLSWDMRSGPQPVLKSPLTGGGHTHPVFSLQISGTRNANNLITSSTDGTVCTWTSDLLAKPQDRLGLVNPAVARNDEVAPTSLSSLPRDPARFIVGTEEGVIYQCNRFDEAGARAGLDPRGYYKGHLAQVTGIDFHDSRGPADLGDYLLSSSLDWSVKLWKIRQFSTPITSTHSGSSSSNDSELIPPILTFNRSDMVYDVSWCPSSPGVFANVEGTGHVELWDLSRDMEVPLSRAKPSSQNDSYLNRPLNKLAWRKPDGSRIAVGGLDGVVTVFDVAIQPSEKESWAKLKRRLGQLEEEE